MNRGTPGASVSGGDWVPFLIVTSLLAVCIAAVLLWQRRKHQ